MFFDHLFSYYLLLRHFIYLKLVLNYYNFHIQILFIAWCVFYFKIKFLINRVTVFD